MGCAAAPTRMWTSRCSRSGGTAGPAIRTAQPCRRGASGTAPVDLARHSDGWTAASATAALTDIGQTDAAARVVAGIPADDIARSDAVCELVDGCLAAGRSEQAAAQVQEAWSWISNLKDEHLQRLTVRRLAELYARAGHPDKARILLAERHRPGFWQRLWSRKRASPKSGCSARIGCGCCAFLPARTRATPARPGPGPAVWPYARPCCWKARHSQSSNCA